MEVVKLQPVYPEWTKSDKKTLLNIQKFLSVVGFFLAIVECTNLFLIYKMEKNGWFLNFGIVTVFVILLNLLVLVWAIQQSEKVNREDEGEPKPDSGLTQFILFLALLINTLFAVHYLLYTFYKTDLTNAYQADHDSKQIEVMDQLLKDKQGWIDFISVANLLVGTFTVFCSYSLAQSANTHRILIYVLIFFSMWVSFAEISNKKTLEQVFNPQHIIYNKWSLNMIFFVAITNVVFLVLTYLANTRKLRIAYMILGSFFLCAVAVQIPATGRLLKDYRALTADFKQHCVPELGKLNVNFVEKQGCPRKYVYLTRAECPVSPNKCFGNPNNCPAKDQLYQVWEKELINTPESQNVMGCVNVQCCGVLANIYTRTLLTQAQLSLLFLFASFFLAVFTFQLSSMDKGDLDMTRNLFYFFSICILLVFVLGCIFCCTGKNAFLPRKTLITGEVETTASTIKIQKNDELDNYLHKTCLPFREFMLKQKTGNTAFLNAVDTTSEVTSLGDLESLTKEDADNNLCPSGMTCNGYVVIIRTPKVQTGTNKCQPRFKDHDKWTVKNNRDVRFLVHPEDDTDKYDKFQVVGTQAEIEKILDGELEVCGYDKTDCDAVSPGSAKDNKFLVRVVKVDLFTWGFDFHETKKTSALELGTHSLRKSINHIRNLASVHTLTSKATHKKSLVMPRTQHLAVTQKLFEEQFNQTKSATLTIIIHDHETDQGIFNATIRVYTNPPTADAEYSDDCKFRQDKKDFITHRPDFLDFTGHDGTAKIELYFKDTTDNGGQTFHVYAAKHGYTENCRKFKVTFKQTKTLTVDLGIGPVLQKGQTRAVLMWNAFEGKNDAADLAKFDLDLWATFGQYTTEAVNFDCHVGITDDYCGGVKHHGDSLTKKIGNSSEAVTFQTIGSYDYLIYWSRYYNKLPDTATPTKWVSDVTSYKPVMKYYSSESKRPVDTRDLADTVSLTTTEDVMQKLDVMTWCVKAKGTATVDPTEKVSKVALANSLWKDTYDQFVTDYNPSTYCTKSSKKVCEQ